MIICVCPGCSTKLNARDDLEGKLARCPRCQSPVRLLSPSPTRQVVLAEETPPDQQTWQETFRAGQKAEQSHPPIIPGYKILGELGRGGMGIVYRARQLNLARIVAVKTVPLGQRAKPAVAQARFEQEARVVARLQHPNIVTAYDFRAVGAHLVLVMELLAGETAEAWVERHGPLDEFTAWGLIRQAAAGLSHAVEVGVIHRDIKPANLILVEAPEGSLLPPGLPLVKITDFGLAWLGESSDGNRLTQADSLLGTPVYMAPEQFSNGTIDARTDVYGLGATAWYLLSGEPPFRGSTVWEVMVSKLNDPLPWKALPAKVPAESRRLLEDMLASDADHRIGSYPELLERIDRLLPGNPKTADAQLPAQRRTVGALAEGAPRGRSRRYALALAVVVLALLTITAGLIAGKRRLGGRGEPEARPAEQPAPLRSGLARPLFDGVSLVGWVVREGMWAAGQDGEGGWVLRGRGALGRAYPPLANYRLSLGVDLAESSAVEIHFGFEGKQGSKASRRLLRVTRRGVLLGRRRGDRGDLESPSPQRALPRSPGPGAAPRYLEVRLERRGDRWWAFFDGELIGSADAARVERPELRLLTEGGEAHFDSLEITYLVEGG